MPQCEQNRVGTGCEPWVSASCLLEYELGGGLAVLTVAGVLLPLMSTRGWVIAVAFVAALASEWLGRYLFFVSVVPKNIAAAFTSGERRAA